jgi:subtilisin-like proprotein convertase family protein/Holliday junction resolvasome RuvABC ATP-dependent DNA helicase subunit
MSIGLSRIRSSYLTAATSADRRAVLKLLVADLGTAKSLELAQVTTLVPMAADVCTDNDGRLGKDLQASITKLFLEKPMDAECIALFRDQLFAKYAANSTADELATARRILGGDKATLDKAAVQKLFALVASEKELTPDERRGLQTIRATTKLTPDAAEEYAARMTEGLLHDIRQQSSTKVADDVAQDLVDAARQSQERDKYVGHLDEMFFTAELSPKAIETFRSIYKDAPSLSATELMLAERLASAPKGSLDPLAMQKLLLRIGANDTLTDAEKELVAGLDAASLPKAARKILDDWKQSGMPSQVRARLDEALATYGALIFNKAGRTVFDDFVAELDDPRALATVVDYVTLLGALGTRIECELPWTKQKTEAVCTALGRGLRGWDDEMADRMRSPGKFALGAAKDLLPAGISNLELAQRVQQSGLQLLCSVPVFDGLASSALKLSAGGGVVACDALAADETGTEHRVHSVRHDKVRSAVRETPGTRSTYYDHEIYSIGGTEYDGSLCSDTSHHYTSWTDGPRLPEAVADALPFVHNDELYVMGGRNEEGPIDKVYKLDVEEGEWIACPDLPMPLADAVGCDAPDGRILLAAKDGLCLYDPAGKKSETLRGLAKPGDDLPRSITLSSKERLELDEDHQEISSAIDVARADRLRTATVTIRLKHPDPSNLVMDLRAPNGRSVTIWNNDDAEVDAKGRSTIEIPLLKDDLQSLRSPDARGEWSLQIENELPEHDGTLLGWSLKLDFDPEVETREPTSVGFDGDRIVLSTHSADTDESALHTIELAAARDKRKQTPNTWTTAVSNGLLVAGKEVWVHRDGTLGKADAIDTSELLPPSNTATRTSRAKAQPQRSPASAGKATAEPTAASAHRLRLVDMTVSELEHKNGLSLDDASELLHVLTTASLEGVLTTDIARRVDALFFDNEALAQGVTEMFGREWFETGLSGLTSEELERRLKDATSGEGVSHLDLSRCLAAARGIDQGDLLILESPLPALIHAEDKALLVETLNDLCLRRIGRLLGGDQLDKAHAELVVATALKLTELSPETKPTLDEQVKRLLLLAPQTAESARALKRYCDTGVAFSPMELRYASTLSVGAGDKKPKKTTKGGGKRTQAASQASPPQTTGLAEILSQPASAFRYERAIAARYEPKQEVVRQILRVAKPGDDTDESLLARLLDALHPDMLAALAKAGYTFTVTRHKVSNADKSLRNASIVTSSSPMPYHIDYAEGVHKSGGKDKPAITVRTYWQDGELTIDANTLVHEIGHAVDLVLNADKNGAWHVQSALADAFTKEHARLPSYFHTQVEFAAEVIGYYLLDPERCERQFPLAYAAIANALSSMPADTRAIAALQREVRPEAIVNLAPGTNDPRKELVFREALNRVRLAEGVPTQPYIIAVKGDLDCGAKELAADLAETLRTERAPEVGRFRGDETLVRIDAATFNDPGKLQGILSAQVLSGHGSVLYLDEIAQIPSSSPGFAVLTGHLGRFGGVSPLIIAGEGADLARIKNALPTVLYCPYEVTALESSDQAKLVAQLARSENFEIDKDAVEAVAGIAKGGGYQATRILWQTIKTAQLERMHEAQKDGVVDVATANHVVLADVRGAKVPRERLPLEEMLALIGQKPAKDELMSVLGQVKVAAARAKAGVEEKRPRLNLLFEGAPGTGKTVFADLFVEELYRIGYLKNKKIAKIRIDDLLENPEAAVKKLFEQNRGGAIFIDEFHQLKDSDAGKKAFRAMIPYLDHHDYADTVFIGAGYAEELRELLDEDPGGPRRFQGGRVPFADYAKDELGLILDKMAGDLNVALPADVRAAALDRLEVERRCMKYFGNAGSVEKVLDVAKKRRDQRLGMQDVAGMSVEDLTRLTVQDFQTDVRVTPEQVWAEINALEGLESIKEHLRDIAALVEAARESGEDPLDYFEPYFTIEGPPGSGKTTVARLLARFCAAYGLVPLPEVVERSATEMLGKFVGSWTTTEVRKTFESAWGRLLFLDEISSLAHAGGDFKEEAKKEILRQLENYRGRYIFVVADYTDGIDDFLGMDAGLARRFGNRLTTEAMDAVDAANALSKILAEAGFDARKVVDAIKQELESIVEDANWASGGDIRKLKNLLARKNARVFMDRRAEGVLPKVLEPEAVASAFEELRREKRAMAAAQARKKETESTLSYATATVSATKDSQKVEQAPTLTADDEKLLKALAEVDKKFAARFNPDPAEQHRQEADAASDYVKALAEKLGLDPEVVVARLAKVKVKVKKLVTVQNLVQKFSYHCPYCGGVNSPSCAYFGPKGDRTTLEWQIQHSLKKPWTEVKTTVREVEEEQEVDRVVSERVKKP